ncbi:hypothetical protein ES703_43583 [subsurface metagenome]
MVIGSLLRINTGYAYSQSVIDGTHPVRVAAGKVIIDRNQVTSPAGQCVKIKGKGSYQGLTFSRLHLGNPTLVENNAPH